MSIVRKGFADDALLQYLLLKHRQFQSTVTELEQAGITSYSKLVAVINDEDVELNARFTACWTISKVHEAIDKRYMLEPLIRAVNSPCPKMRVAAIHSLSTLKSKRATHYLVNRACDKQEDFNVRLYAIQGLSGNKNPNYFSRLRAIIFDETDDIRSRCEALEWLNYPSDFDSVKDYIELIQHPLPDLRFWAAYRLSQENQDISEALDILDKVTAFDHQLPTTWGWHIDREALQALEGIYWRKFTSRRRYWPHPPTYLISPAPEYDTFVHNYQTYSEDGFYGNLPLPTIDMKIDPNWLKRWLVDQWPKAEVDLRDPKPKTYVLDWKIRIGQQTLIGGLHRDQYTVVLAGSEIAIMKFAVWYRSIISKDQ